MKLTKHGHATVEIDTGEGIILIDPSAFSPNVEELLARASVILVTHEHADHVDPDGIRAALDARPGLAVYGPAAVVTQWDDGSPRAVVAHPGQRFTLAGVEVSVHGGHHAQIYPGIDSCDNVGYLVGGVVFHPGDSFEMPDAEVHTLLVPISGPWLKVAEVVAFVNSVKPKRAFAIHDMLLSQVGHAMIGRHIGEGGNTIVPVTQLAPGQTVDL